MNRRTLLLICLLGLHLRPAAAGVQGLAHINIAVADLDRAIDFYQRRLSFAVIYRTVIIERQVKFALLQKGSCVLELTQPADTTVVNKGVDGSIPHYALQVSGLDSIVLEMKQAGVRFIREPFSREKLMNGFKAAFIAGPSGEAIELIEYYGTSPTVKSATP